MATWAEEKIQLANSYKMMYDNGEISKEELQELLQDIIRTDEVYEEASNMEMKAAVEFAVMNILKVV
jgi:polyhydroxyalkanoate synthesis regulator phasin